jgi:hypothetical protein
MRKLLISTAVSLALCACGGDNNDGTGPTSLNITGTFIGDYTATIDPGSVYQGVLQLTQHVSNVSGSLTTNAGRSANVSGSLSGTRLTASFNFTDSCGGSANATADITNGATRLTGNYTASDCLGTYSGGFILDKQ